MKVVPTLLDIYFTQKLQNGFIMNAYLLSCSCLAPAFLRASVPQAERVVNLPLPFFATLRLGVN